MFNPTLSNFARSPFIVAGVAFALLLSLLGLFSPLIGPYNPLDQQLRLRHVPPMSSGTAVDRTQDPPVERERLFVLGTDHLGRDMLSRLIASFKFYAYAGLLAWGLGSGLALLLIALRGGPGRAAVSSPYRPFPLAVLNASTLVLSGLILSVGHLLMWGYVRVWIYTSQTYQIDPAIINMLAYTGILSAFIPAALLYQSLQQGPSAGGNNTPDGGNWGWWMVRQALLLAPVSVSLAALLSLFIEYPWSFLGFGVQPPQSTLGLMLSQGRQYIVTAWWVVYIPLALVIISIAAFLAIAIPLSRWQNRGLHAVRQGVAGPPSEASAPFLDRAGAFAIDLVLLYLLYAFVPLFLSFLVIILIYFTRDFALIGWLFNPGSQILAYVLMVAYFPFFWATSGQTPGMKVFGIRVARTDGAPVAPLRAALRLVGLVASGAVLLLGLIWVFFDARNQGWHDKLAGTLVVRAAVTSLQDNPSASAG